MFLLKRYCANKPNQNGKPKMKMMEKQRQSDKRKCRKNVGRHTTFGLIAFTYVEFKAIYTHTKSQFIPVK